MSYIKDEDNTIESENQTDAEETGLNNDTQEVQETQEVYEAKPEDLTGVNAKGPPALQRRKILMYTAIAFAAIVMLGMGFTMAGGNRGRAQAAPDGGFAAGPPRDFLRQEMERSLRNPLLTDADFDTEDPYDFSHLFNEWPLPPPQQVVVQQLPPQQPQPLRQQPQHTDL